MDKEIVFLVSFPHSSDLVVSILHFFRDFPAYYFEHGEW